MAHSFSKVTPENLRTQGTQFVHVATHTRGFVHRSMLQHDIYSSPLSCGKIDTLEICGYGEKLEGGKKNGRIFFLLFPIPPSPGGPTEMVPVAQTTLLEELRRARWGFSRDGVSQSF